MSFVYILVPIIAIIGLLRKCRECTWGRCKDTSSLHGRVYLVTGANSGIGKETVRELVKRKARVIMACRDVDGAKNVAAEIRKETAAGEMVMIDPPAKCYPPKITIALRVHDCCMER